MKLFWRISAFAMIFLTIYYISEIGEFSGEVKKNVEIYDVRVHKEYSKTWAIKGTVKNISNKNIAGYVKIKFIDVNGSIKSSFNAPVNDIDYFSPYQSAYFEYYTGIEDFDGIVDYDVIFYER